MFLTWGLPVRVWMRRLGLTQRREGAETQVPADGNRDGGVAFVIVLRCGIAVVCGKGAWCVRREGGKAGQPTQPQV